MKVAVVILNWNGKKDTIGCLASLGDTPDLIVVDNGSTDDSVGVLSKQFPHVTLLQTGQNLGYAGGNNVGIEYALKNGAEAVLLLNNDTIVDAHFIPVLVQAAREKPNIGIFGAYPCRFSDPSHLDHLGGVWNKKTGQFDLIGLAAPKGFQTDVSLDYVCGCSILIRREVFEKIGTLEASFFLYWEEADFCIRAKRAGFGIDVCYDAHLLHKVSASFTGGTPQKTYYWWRGRCLWIKRNCSREERKRLYKTVILPEIFHILKLRWIKGAQLPLLSLLKTKNLAERSGKVAQYKAALKGFRDYILFLK